MTHANPQLIKDLTNIKRVNSIRILLHMLDQAVVYEGDLVPLLHTGVKTIRTAARLLEQNGLISIRRNKADNLIMYMIEKKYFDIEDTCKECKFLQSKEIVIEKTNEKYDNLKCSKKGKVCENKTNLEHHTIVKYFMRNSEKHVLEIYNRKISEGKTLELTSQWRSKEFIKFYIDMFKRIYSNLIPPSKTEVRSSIESLIVIFKEASKTNWKRLLKRYIVEVYKVYKENNQILNPQKLTDKSTVGNFIRGTGKKVDEVKHCNYHGLYCSFYKLKICTLPQGYKTCSDVIRNKMLKLYN